MTHTGSRQHVPLSELLARTATDESRDRISVGDLLELAADRAYGALMFVFALPNIVPTPPGTSALLGLPLVLLSLQFLYGRRTPWLPRIIAARSILRKDFASLVSRTTPLLRRFERILKPRWSILVSPIAERVLGLGLLILAIIVFLPIPLGNILPAAAICVLALALVEHDGMAAVLGLVIGVLSVMLIWSALFALTATATAVIKHLTG